MGRLIDADEFISYLITRYGGNDTGDDIIEDLYYQPTVDAVERKRGRWELIDDTEFRIPGYRCSVCHCECEDWSEKPTFRFCPNCGAEMRKGR